MIDIPGSKPTIGVLLRDPSSELHQEISQAVKEGTPLIMTAPPPPHTDAERMDWLEKNPNANFTYHEHAHFGKYWRKTFGPKDNTNRFKSLREAIDADIDGKIR